MCMIVHPDNPILICHYCIFDESPHNELTEEDKAGLRYIHICCGMSVCMYHTAEGNHAHVNSPRLRGYV